MSDVGSLAPPPRLAPSWALAAAAAAVGSLVYATHLYLYHRLQEQPASFTLELAEAAAHFGAWAVLVPLVWGLGRRWNLLDRRWPSRLLLHLGLGLLVALVQLLLHTFLDQLLIHGWHGATAFRDEGRRLFVRTYFANVVVYFGLVVGDGALSWARHRRAREAELARHLTQAQLDALRQQLQPHFLFNALNAVSTLVADEPAAAQRMIVRLAELLRQALDVRNAAEIPMWRELELAAAYLAIEHIRFGERLAVAIDVPPAVRLALVPGLLLQPLLENAVRHGVARRPGPCRIDIVARADGDVLTIRVVDCGVVFSDGAGNVAAAESERERDGSRRRAGIGLDNVRARLRHLYGDAQRLELHDLPGGTAADVRVPLRVPAGPPDPALEVGRR
jgi:two-component system LytT family sensor kinase